MTQARTPWARVLGLWVFGAPALGLLVVGPSGRWDWERGWAYVALLLGGAMVQTLATARFQPELLERRTRTGAGVQRWDLVILGLMRLCTMGALGLSGWEGSRAATGAGWLVAGGLATVLGYGVVIVSLCWNPFFEGTVRLQSDRDQQVITSGPYGVVRHPGYAGFALLLLGGPLFLGSPAGTAVMAMAVALLVLRTALEDRFLTEQLAGYAEYRGRVRFRLIPGLW